MDGSEEFAEFCRSAHPELVAALAHHTADRWLAEELAHEALIRAADRWSSVRQLSSPVGWTFRVGANLAASHFRSRRAEQRARRRMQAAGSHVDEDVAERLVVDGALQQLPAAQREVVVLRYFLGLTAEEAGQVTGMSAGAVRVACHRALSVLREVLDVDDEVEPIKEATDAS